MKMKNISLMILTSLALIACNNDKPLSNDVQVGPNPELPKAQDFLIPPMQAPSYAGWAKDASPKVAEGLKIERIAEGLLHPRQVYTLPNGDI